MSYLTTPICEWLRLLTGLPESNVFEVPTTGTAPTGAYITYHVVSDSPTSQSWASREASEDELWAINTRTRPRKIMVSIDVFADDPIEYLDRIGEGMHRHGAVEILDEINVVFLGLGDVRNLSFAGDTRFKARWQSDATFRTFRNIVDEVEAVSTLTVNGDITEN